MLLRAMQEQESYQSVPELSMEMSVKELTLRLQDAESVLNGLNKRRAAFISRRLELRNIFRNSINSLRFVKSLKNRVLLNTRIRTVNSQAVKNETDLNKINVAIERWSSFLAGVKGMLYAKETESVVTENESTPAVIAEPDLPDVEELPIETEQKDLMTWVKENVIYIILGVVILALLLWRNK